MVMIEVTHRTFMDGDECASHVTSVDDENLHEVRRILTVSG